MAPWAVLPPWTRGWCLWSLRGRLVVQVKGRHDAGFGAQLQSPGGSRCEMELWGQHRGATALSGTVGRQCFRCTSGKPSENGGKASSFLLGSHMGAEFCTLLFHLNLIFHALLSPLLCLVLEQKRI